MRFKCSVFQAITGSTVDGTSRDEEDLDKAIACVSQLCEEYSDPDFVVRMFSTTVSSGELVKLRTLRKYPNVYLCVDYKDICLR